jgi:hypothetical protein
MNSTRWFAAGWAVGDGSSVGAAVAACVGRAVGRVGAADVGCAVGWIWIVGCNADLAVAVVVDCTCALGCRSQPTIISAKIKMPSL